VALDWNDGAFILDTKGEHPAFYIEAAGQKSRRSLPTVRPPRQYPGVQGR